MKKWFIAQLWIVAFTTSLVGQRTVIVPSGARQDMIAKPLGKDISHRPIPIQNRSTGSAEALDLPGTTLPEGARFEKARLLLPGTQTPQEYTLKIANGFVFLSDDIALFTEAEYALKKLEKGGIIPYAISRWTGGQIPYVLPTTHPSYAGIVSAINYINATTNICMVPRTTQEDYVEFIRQDSSACWSYVGRLGGKQPINVDGCSVGSIVHEICHSAGMWHEHSRNDRDTYVTVMLENVLPDYENNFEKYGASGTDIGTYDYGSLMHYSKYAFSKNGLPTVMVNTPPGSSSTVIGQRTGLSSADVTTLNGMYPEKTCAPVENRPTIDLAAPIGITPSPVVAGQAFKVNTNFTNAGGSTFVGCYYAALFDKNDEFVRILTGLQEVAGLPKGFTYTNSLEFSIPAFSIPSGMYSLGIFYSLGCTDDYMLAGDVDFPNLIPVQFADSTAPSLVLQPDNLAFTASGGTLTTEITSNIAWTVTDTISWLNVSAASGSGNTTLTVVCAAQSGTSARSGTIVVSGGGITRTLTVTQSGVGPTLSVAPTSIFFSGAAGSREVIVSSNTTWFTSAAPSWLAISPATGNGNGAFTVSCQSNPGITSRTATITVSGNGVAARFISITQEGADAPLTVSPQSLSFGDGGGIKSVAINAFVAWTVTTSATWISATPTTGNGNATLMIQCTPNTAPEARSGFVTITGTGGITQTVQIAQDALIPYLEVSTESLNFEALGGNLTFAINSNTAWRVNEALSWITIEPSTGTGSGVVTVTALPKTGSSYRFGTIFIYGTGTTTKRVSVTQVGSTFTLTVSPTTLSVPFAGGTVSATVASNTDWSVSESASWLSVSPGTGTGNGALSITASANTAIASRSADILVQGVNTDPVTLRVTQAGAPAVLTVSSDSIIVSAQAGTATLTIQSNTTWSIAEAADWFTVSPVSSSGNGTVLITFLEQTVYAPRTATLTVSAPGLGSKTVTVVQRAKERALVVTPGILEFPVEGGTLSASVNTTRGWQAVTAASWIELTPAQGSGSGQLSVRCAENTSTTARSAQISVSVPNEAPEVIQVNQPGAVPFLTLARTTMNYAGVGGTLTLKIASNTSWRISEMLTWVSVSTTSGSDDGVVRITVQPRVSGTPRSGVITIYGTGITSKKLTINQAGAGQGAMLEVSTTALTFDGLGGSKAFNAFSNVPWTASVSESWLTVTPTTGFDEQPVSVSCPPNVSPLSRTATITLSESGGMRVQVAVTQEGSGADAVLTVSKTSLSFPADGGLESFSIASNTSWGISKVPTWLEVSQKTGILDRPILMQAQPNRATTPRIGTFAVKGAGVDTVWVAVAQAAAPPTLAITPDTLRYTWSGGVQTLRVQSNVAWEAAQPEDWIAPSLRNSVGDTSIAVTVEPNPDSSPRLFTWTFRITALTRDVVILQAARPEVDLPESWNVTPTDFNHTVLIAGDLVSNIEGSPLEPGDVVGVFYKNNNVEVCAGNGQWMGLNTPFPVFGDDPATLVKDGMAENEPFILKVFRVSTGQPVDVEGEYLPLGANPLINAQGTYEHDAVSMITALRTIVLDSQVLTLQAGWNTVSSYIIPKLNVLDELAKNPPSFVVQLENGAGQTFSFDPPVNTIGTWRVTEGYRVQTTEPGTLTVRGKVVDPLATPIPFVQGWQIIPFFSRKDKLITSALSSIRGQIVTVKDNAGKVYSPLFGLNTIRMMRPGQGYYLNARSAGTLTYPADYMEPVVADGAEKAAEAREVAEPQTTYYAPASIPVTGSDATLIVLYDGLSEILSAGDELGVFGADQRLWATATVTGQNQAIILRGDDASVAGRQGFFKGEPFTLRVWKQSTQTEFVLEPQFEGEKAEYQTNALLILQQGRLSTYQASDKTAFSLRVFPNPTTDVLSISLEQIQRGPVTVRLLDLNGRELIRREWIQLNHSGHVETFDLSSYAEGMYLVQVAQAGGFVTTQKVTVTRR